MLYTIYRVTHIETGKTYIGKHQTLDPNDGYLGSGKMIKNAVKKHGSGAFKKEVLHVFETESEMNAKEAELVTQDFCLREDTYNLCPGGHGGWGFVHKISSQAKENQRKAASLTGKKHQVLRSKAGYQNGLKDYWLGRTHSEETKRILSERAKLRTTNSQTGTMWITNGFESRKVPKNHLIPMDWIRGRKIIQP